MALTLTLICFLTLTLTPNPNLNPRTQKEVYKKPNKEKEPKRRSNKSSVYSQGRQNKIYEVRKKGRSVKDGSKVMGRDLN